MIFFLILIATLIPSYFIWTAIHELSHLAMMRIFRKLTNVQIKLYPHKDLLGNFVWASVSGTLDAPTISNYERAAISLAPRIPGFVALVLFALTGVITNSIILPVWIGFWGCGLIDFLYGSIGVTPESDLRSAADALSYSPWEFRLIGWALGLASLTNMLIWTLC